MKYVHILLISCLLLCSCPYEEEAEPENNSSTIAVPSSSSVESAEPSILDCPIEDLEKEGKYPLPEYPPREPNSVGYCPSPLELSAEELSFNAQGGVRCITSRGLMWRANVKYCYEERILRFPDGSTFIGTYQEFAGSGFWGTAKFKRLVCPWFIATAVDIWSEEHRPTLHISVNKNEAGNEREAFVSIISRGRGECSGGFKITQSP
jgi:hypothetical protein